MLFATTSRVSSGFSRQLTTRGSRNLFALPRLGPSHAKQEKRRSGRCHDFARFAQDLHAQRWYTWYTAQSMPSIHPVCALSDKSYSTKATTELSYGDLVALLKSGDIQLFDVREPSELTETGYIPKSVNIPLGDLKKALDMESDTFEKSYGAEKPKESDSNIVFHCLAGIRSAKAMATAHNQGFAKARHYPGGWEEWAEKRSKGA